MSLMERVHRAHDTTSSEASRVTTNKAEDLKHELYRRVTSDEIARLVRDNPLRARNEIKSACARIFESEAWSGCSSEEQAELTKGLLDAIFGLGPLEILLNDDRVTEIMVNGSGSVFYERGGVIHPHEHVFTSDDQVRALIDRIVGPLGRRVDESSPMVNARLEEGHRVNAIIPPLSLDGPTLTIRKFREHIYTLEEMVHLGSMDDAVRLFLTWAVLARNNIAVSGGTGSGKTTLLNALSCVIPEGERIVTIEDSAELKFLHHPHVVRLESRPRNAEGIGEVSIRDLVINSLRMRPDRIIVGECRGGEALDMLQAMNTGHDGSLTTLHANSSMDAISRLTTMVRYVVDLPVEVIESQIASAIDMVVQTARTVDGHRFVQEIMVMGRADQEMSPPRFLYRYDSKERRGVWLAPHGVVEGFCEKGAVGRTEVASWLQQVFPEA